MLHEVTKAMQVDYIIVQAGGKGTRLEGLTKNKPKAIVPVENLPMLFHLFRKYPDKSFVVIADYKKEVLREYLACFAGVKYQVVDAAGTGTCSGVRQAMDLLPDAKPFMLVWSDLILPEKFRFPEREGDYLGVSESFPCRWSYRDGEFHEQPSSEFGVAGLFIFKDKSLLKDVPQSGELVRWMKEKRSRFQTVGLGGTREFGFYCDYEKLAKEKCRPFNRITVDGDTVIKEALDAQGKNLAAREGRWYQLAQAKGLTCIPRVYSFDPLRMELIKGKNIYEYDLPYDEKKAVLKKLTDALGSLHETGSISADTFSLKEAYYTKTMDRLQKIRDLVPFADRKIITVNGRKCRNIYCYKRELEKKLDSMRCRQFSFIHGDCTFSNMMLKDGKEPVLIDPRGYFGFTENYGDPLYDWAKLYYSIKGNYDRFNLKEFSLAIRAHDVELTIASNHWEDMERDFFEMSGTDEETIALIHAVIWLSLTTYAWQDYDSICGAFYNGLYYLEQTL
jgi:GTP:adenosylcobinamide-phosphate guanylyltransferase/tRNA A-37 threonylcarbamoyl transferase component Bud32